MPAPFQPCPATEYFTGLSHTYAAYRPTYPLEAFSAMLAGLSQPVHAVDVGCGTGISTRLLAHHGASVIGIDPNHDMLQEARSTPLEQTGDLRNLPMITYQFGTADQTGLPDNSADLVLCAQSFHWFTPDTALREFHRILNPQGRLALMWNVRDDADPFTSGYGDAVRTAQSAARTAGRTVPEARSVEIDDYPYFTGIHTLKFPSSQSLDLEGLLGRLQSASYFPREGQLRTKLEQDLSTLFANHQQKSRVHLKYRCEVTLASPQRHEA
ncbi:MAG TPA: class I SAM-dependent methyltransferase [Phycisphaerales bacterium]|nr:class I SAM-dependent methyltransferase [Phycisphaerales bacterium]